MIIRGKIESVGEPLGGRFPARLTSGSSKVEALFDSRLTTLPEVKKLVGRQVEIEARTVHDERLGDYDYRIWVDTAKTVDHPKR